MESRGVDKVNLRVYAINPLDLNCWPFPDEVVKVDEAQAPPMPGEEPAYGTVLGKQIRLLGSPDYSEVVSLPTKEKGAAASFGVDLAAAMKRIGRDGKAGAYLVGYRRLGADTSRYYARIKVTDLCLTLVEEARGLVFVVTSVSTGKPIAGASVALEALTSQAGGAMSTKALLSGTTDREGNSSTIT